MATLTERLAILVEANAGQAIAQFKALGTSTKSLSGDVGKAGGAIANLGGSLGSLIGSAGPEAAVGAIGLAFAKISASGVTAFTDLAGQVKEFRRVAGGTAEDASKLVAGFSAVGVDATTAATGVFQLEKHLATGAAKLETFGVTAQKNAKGQTDMSATLLSVGDAYKRIQDPIERAALLTAAFGRAGTSLVPLLGKSREEIQAFFDAASKHGEILSDADLKMATDYKLAMHDLGQAFKGLEIEAGKALIPFLTDTAHAITGTIELIDKIHGLLAIRGGKVDSLGSFFDSLIHGKTAADTATTSTHSLGDALSGVTNILDGFKTADTEATKSLDDLDKALTSATDADHALVDAHQKTLDAQAALNKLQKQGAVDAQKVADANRSLADANRSVGHAQREQAKAQDEYNKALAASNILGTDTAKGKLTDASNNLADANDNLAGAQDRAKVAGDALAAAKAGDPEYQLHLADAVTKVGDAKYNESQKSLASVTAHDAEAKSLSDNADQAQRLYDKYQNLIKQHPDVALALSGNVSALLAVGGPQLGPPAPPPPAVPAATINSSTRSNIITVNVNSDRQIDPTHLTRTIVWALN